MYYQNRFYSLLMGAMMLLTAGNMRAQSWLDQLRRQEIVDSIVRLADQTPLPASPYCSYMIYYHQPLQHDTPSGEQFRLRALLTHRAERPSLQRPRHRGKVTVKSYITQSYIKK